MMTMSDDIVPSAFELALSDLSGIRRSQIGLIEYTRNRLSLVEVFLRAYCNRSLVMRIHGDDDDAFEVTYSPGSPEHRAALKFSFRVEGDFLPPEHWSQLSPARLLMVLDSHLIKLLSLAAEGPK